MLAAIMILGAAISAAIASAKNRNIVGWMIAGALFPVVSILILACQSALPATLPAEPQPQLPGTRSA